MEPILRECRRINELTDVASMGIRLYFRKGQVADRRTHRDESCCFEHHTHRTSLGTGRRVGYGFVDLRLVEGEES